MSGEILVVGAGMAGLTAAQELGSRGMTVDIIDRDIPPEYRSVYSRGLQHSWGEIFSPGNLRTVPFLRAITIKGTDFTLAGDGSYSMVDYPATLARLKDQLPPSVTLKTFPSLLLETAEYVEDKTGVLARIDGSSQRYDYVIDATGPKAAVCRQVDKDRMAENPLVEYIYGGKFKGYIEDDAMILVFGPAGGTCWVCPSIDKDYVDIVFSAWGWENHWEDFLETADRRLEILTDFIKDKKGVQLDGLDPELLFSGFIRSDCIDKPHSYSVYGIGEAGATANPLTGDSLRSAVKSGKMIAANLSLDNPQLPAEFDARMRKETRKSGFLEGSAYARLGYQKSGNLGELVDMFGKALEEGDSSDVIKKAGEDLLVEGKFNPCLLPFILKHYKLLNYVLRSLHLEIMFRSFGKENVIQPHNALPSVA
jgi:flavin-dependent dehydrogenase